MWGGFLQHSGSRWSWGEGEKTRNEFLLSNQKLCTLKKILEVMSRALIGFMVLSFSLKGYFASITLC